MPGSPKFGTFSGVFTPSILTILGVIMFLRLPMIIGEAGLLAAIGIIVVAHTISLTTGLSVSSIATDKKVQAGGTYYMISRSLGLPIGGTLGIALFIGLSFSVSLYLIGFAESFVAYWGLEPTRDTIRLTGTIVLVVVSTVTLISTSLAIKTQYFIMAAIVLSLLSVLLGRHGFTPSEPLLLNPGSTIPLMVLFGIYFPAVTGFEAGVSMSGDLRDPKKSIPTGTIAAIAMGFVVYIGLATFLAFTVDGAKLATDPEVLLDISLFPQLVVAGIWGATLSSAFGSILGAPRILQAAASDRIAPSLFSRGSGPAREPRNALLLTVLIAEGGILIGELNIIARIVSIFFITTYGFLNLSCAFEVWTSADFRPEFRSPVWVSLLGAIACVVVMIQLDFAAMVGGILLLGGLFALLKRKELRLETGDAWSSVWASLVKSGIERLTRETTHQRNWRPNIIMFRGEADDRSHLQNLGAAITGRLGVLSNFELSHGEADGARRLEPLEPVDNAPVHTLRHYCTDVYAGMKEIIRLYGFSGVHPNTVLMGWSKQVKSRPKFLDVVRTVMKSDMNVVLLRHHPTRQFGDATTLDVWWDGRGSDLSFAITLLRYLSTSVMWQTARMRLLVVNDDASRTEKVYRTLHRTLRDYRMEIEVRIIEREQHQLSIEEIIQRESGGADLTIIGLAGTTPDRLEVAVERLEGLFEVLGSVIIVHGSSQFEDLDIGIADENEETIAPLGDSEIQLPPVPSSRSPLLSEDLQKLEANGDRVLRLLFERGIATWFTEERRLIAALSDIGLTFHDALDRASRFPDPFRRRKAIVRIQNEYLFRCRSLVTSINDDILPTQRDSLAAALDEYAERLARDAARIPASFRMIYSREDLQPTPDDTAMIRVRKAGHRMVHGVLGYPATRSVPYRKTAEHHLLHTRHVFLKAFLQQFLDATMKSLSAIKSEMLGLAASFHELEVNLTSRGWREEDVDQIMAAFRTGMESLDTAAVARHRLYNHRLHLEFRNALVALRDEMERFGGTPHSRRQRVSPKVYKELIRVNRTFADTWMQDVRLVAEKVTLDIALASLQGRVNDRAEELLTEIHRRIDAHVLSPLARVREKFHQALKQGTDVSAEFEVEPSFGFLESLDEAREDIHDLTRTLPESMLVCDEEGSADGGLEAVEVPAVRLAQHHLESLFVSPVQQYLTEAGEQLRKSAYAIKDQVNLTKFEVDNIDRDTADRASALSAIVTSALSFLEREQKHLGELKKQVSSVTRTAVEQSYSPLAPHMIVKSAVDLQDVLRGYKGRWMRSSFDRYAKLGRDFLENNLVRLIYSRSVGVLMAGKTGLSSTAPIAEVQKLVASVTPKPEVIKSLPQFYANLFSGKSTIGEEFWVPRKTEEDAFARAVRRFRAGGQGAVLLLGSRNAGKTSFCRRVDATNFTKGSQFHVFPPREGSVDRTVFAATLAHVTRFSGDASEILRSLPHGSAVFLHDIELWFERSSTGLDVLSEIHSLIESFSRDLMIVLNTSPAAFSVIRHLEPLHEVCTEVIHIAPMSAEDLKTMIMLRHASSGMQYRLGRRSEEELSGYLTARLFDACFRASDGNPGTALNAWLSCIIRVNERVLEIRKADVVSPELLGTLDPDWLVILAQVVIHKRLTIAKAERITAMNSEAVQRTIRRMTTVGLLHERSPGVYTINPYIDRLVHKLLEERQIL